MTRKELETPPTEIEIAYAIELLPEVAASIVRRLAFERDKLKRQVADLRDREVENDL